MTAEKPRKSFWQLFNLSFGFFGIQIGFALQNANMSRIFQSLGASIEELPILWLAWARLVLHPLFGETHALADDPYAHAIYGFAFFFGVDDQGGNQQRLALHLTQHGKLLRCRWWSFVG